MPPECPHQKISPPSPDLDGRTGFRHREWRWLEVDEARSKCAVLNYSERKFCRLTMGSDPREC